MHSHDDVPVGISHVLDGDITQDAGIIDKDVNSSIGLDGSVDDLVAVYHIVIIGNSLAASIDNLLDHQIGWLSRS